MTTEEKSYYMESYHKFIKENEEKTETKKKPEPFFYCMIGGVEPLCSKCKRNHLNSNFSTEEISNWYQPRANASRKRCKDYIKL